MVLYKSSNLAGFDFRPDTGITGNYSSFPGVISPDSPWPLQELEADEHHMSGEIEVRRLIGSLVLRRSL